MILLLLKIFPNVVSTPNIICLSVENLKTGSGIEYNRSTSIMFSHIYFLFVFDIIFLGVIPLSWFKSAPINSYQGDALVH